MISDEEVEACLVAWYATSKCPWDDKRKWTSEAERERLRVDMRRVLTASRGFHGVHIAEMLPA